MRAPRALGARLPAAAHERMLTAWRRSSHPSYARSQCLRQGASQCNVARITSHRYAFLVWNVSVADLCFRIGEAQRTTRSGKSKRVRTSERESRIGFHKAE